MKIKILYPTAVAGLLKKEPVAGDLIDIPDGTAKALIEEGFAEKHDAKPAKPAKPAPVERATAAPGEKRRVGRPKKAK